MHMKVWRVNTISIIINNVKCLEGLEGFNLLVGCTSFGGLTANITLLLIFTADTIEDQSSYNT